MSTMAPTLMTAAELLALGDDGRRHELVRGELRTTMPPGFEHGRYASKLGRILSAFVERHGLGETTVETGFQLAGDPDTVRAPDIAFVSAARLHLAGTGFFPGSPDLAVEIVSPGDTHEEVAEKIDDYLSLGTRVVWVVRPKSKSVSIHRADRPVKTVRRDGVLDEPELLPEFALPLTELFGT
ncbi:MAG: Uma2 family endonuclease [Verrucomicrobia bacterium]|nr:Uma2 family endonuclease [Verrucomicrobiota bacterium]